MKTYIISSGEHSDYSVSHVVRAGDMSRDDLREYQLEATRRNSLYHDKRMEKIADYLGVPQRRNNFEYRQVVGHKKFEEAIKALFGGWDYPDSLSDILRENGVEVLEYTEYNLDDL